MNICKLWTTEVLDNSRVMEISLNRDYLQTFYIAKIENKNNELILILNLKDPLGDRVCKTLKIKDFGNSFFLFEFEDLEGLYCVF